MALETYVRYSRILCKVVFYYLRYYPIGQCIIGIPSSKWGVNHSHPSYDYYIGFVKAVANVSYHSLDLFKKYANDDTLNSVDMLDLAVKVCRTLHENHCFKHPSSN